MNRIIIFFLIFFLSAFTISAQNQVSPNETISADSELQDDGYKADILTDTLLSINTITIPSDTIAALKIKKEFAYEKNLDSLLKASQNEQINNPVIKKRSSSGSFLDAFFASGIVEIILWSIAILFVIFILYNLFLSKGAFRRTGKKSPEAEQISEEEIFENENYDSLLNQAYKLQDFRLAVRYLFLKTLQKLNESSLIEFATGKTNTKYVYEVPQNKRNEFAALVLNYEYVWYGHVTINKELYDAIETKFSTFFNKI
jgi:hypothetical protein